MKKLILISISLILLSTHSFSQYRINKFNYDYHSYYYRIGDPYNPTVAGVASFLIPGLGQMVSGESVRGLTFFGADLGCWIIYAIGYSASAIDIANGGTGAAGAGQMLIGLLGSVVVDIWSTVDAVHVAKVNNLAFRDKYMSSLNYKIMPYFGNKASIAYNEKMPIGITLNITF